MRAVCLLGGRGKKIDQIESKEAAVIDELFISFQ